MRVEAARVDFSPLTWSKFAQRRLLGRECGSGLGKERGAEQTELEALWNIRKSSCVLTALTLANFNVVSVFEDLDMQVSTFCL